MSLPESRATASGVLLVGAFAYEHWTTHRSLRTLAERLAGAGHVAMRLDLTGLGDSSGDLWDDGLVEAWLGDVRSGLTELRSMGCTTVSVVGLRLGALLASLAASSIAGDEPPLDAFVGWVPVTDGRRYTKELRLMSAGLPDGEVASHPEGTRYLAGSVLTPGLLADVTALSAEGVGHIAGRALLIDRSERPSSATLAAALGEHGVAVTTIELEGAGSMLDEPTEYATVPVGHVDAIVGWLGPAVPAAGAQDAVNGAPSDVDAPGPVEVAAGVRESVIRLGSLVAVECAPAQGAPRATVLFANTGAEHHVGSGRAWVELGRTLAGRGVASVRLDFRGWGESPDDGHAPGRPYDAHALDDLADAVIALRARTEGPIVLAGICAGAWVILQRCAGLPVDGVVAFNVQLYWRPGDPVEATMAETHQRRQPIIARDRRLADRRVWSLLDTVGVRNEPARWLDRIGSAAFPVHLVFEKGDDGLEYLRSRLGRRVRVVERRGGVHVREMPGLDHPMHRQWRRTDAIDEIEALLARVPGAKGAA